MVLLTSRLVVRLCNPIRRVTCLPGDFGVDAVGALPLFLESLTRCRRFALMHGRSFLQPCGFGGFGFRLGLCSTRFGSGFVGNGLPPFDSGFLQLGPFANLFRLPHKGSMRCSAHRDYQGSNQQDCHECGDHDPDDIARAHDGLR
ncbi:hypothetical protein [Mycobacterium sp.]|uniref:hypothetical protein n=1 Tax=Mycobacterium sp. TaxID=1785 RepID=UPI003C790189